MRELLIGYLLDALDSAERARVERLLAADPALRAELAELKAALKPLDEDPEHLDPPPELAARTCESLWRLTDSLPGHGFSEDADLEDADLDAELEDAELPQGFEEPASAEPSPAAEMAAPLASRPVPSSRAAGFSAAESPARNGWRFHDVAVAAGICIASALLIFPAIDQSRTSAQIAACANNLRQLGMALANYSQFQGGGFLPHVPSQGNLAGAGVYAPTLVSTGHLNTPQTVVCPGSTLAADPAFRVPTLVELERAKREELDRLRAQMGGSYGYTLGYFKNGKYQVPRDERRDDFAVAADAPSLHLPGLQSANHSGRGQNVLFESGRVAFWKKPRVAEAADGLFTNQHGYIEAGANDSDSVIGASTSVPMREGDGF